MTLYESKPLKAVSRSGESEAEFRTRLADLRRECRDTELERIRKRYQPRLATLQQRERRALQAVEKRTAVAQQRTLDVALRTGGGLLAAFLGRKTTATQAGTVVRSAGRAMQQRQEISQASETVGAVRLQIAQLGDELKAELRKVEVESGEEGPLIGLPEDHSRQPLWRL